MADTRYHDLDVLRAFALLLVGDHYLDRESWIGRLLNGRRERPEPSAGTG